MVIKTKILVFLIFVSTCSAFWDFDTFKSFYQDDNGYLSQSVSYLQDIFHKLKRANEVTNALIDEECIFECPYNHKAVPNPDHVKKANGCGSLNIIFDDSDASPVRLDREFTECCNEHDFCYDTCGADKDLCDLQLKKCMYSVCKTKKSELFEVKPCKMNAKAAYLLVMAMGCPLYRDSQKEACVCKKKRRDEL